MAKNKPNEPNPSEQPDDQKDKNNPSKLPDWLRTDDWLQVTPPPQKDHPILAGLDEGKTSEDQATEMIELEEEADLSDSPPSTMLFSDPDDSIVMMDDLPISGPLSGMLRSGTPSSPRLRIDPTLSSVSLGTTANSNPQPQDTTALPLASMDPPKEPEVASSNSDDSIDLSKVPAAEYPQFSGPPTSRNSLKSRTPSDPISSEDVLGGPLPPTGPSSGWLASATGLPKVVPPSIPQISSTWAELGEVGKGSNPIVAPAVPPAKSESDSWHPSAGSVNFQSLDAIDLPPIGGGPDTFREATRFGTLPQDVPLESVKPRPTPAIVAPPVVEPPVAKPTPAVSTPRVPSAAWTSLPSLPAQNLPGSWHPSSGNVAISSLSEIDLPPEASGAGMTEAAKAEAMPVSKLPNGLKTLLPKSIPTPLEPVSLPELSAVPPPLEPASLPELNAVPLDMADLEPTQPASGWLAGSSTNLKPTEPTPVEPPTVKPTPVKPPEASWASLDSLDVRSNAEIDVPPIRSDETDASDIFSTARRDSTNPTGGGGSALFSGAVLPESGIFGSPATLPGDSNLFGVPDAKLPPRTGPSHTTIPIGRADASPNIDLGELFGESPSQEISFAIPPKSTGDSNPSSIEILDTSGTLDGGLNSMHEDRTETNASAATRYPDEERLPEPDFGMTDEASIEDLLRSDLLTDDDGRPDFDVLHSGLQSDSNLLGDRTFVEQNLQDGPNSSGVNLMDPEHTFDDHADSGPASSIFNKADPAAQSAGGRVDIDEIPMMGSSDEGTDAIFDGGGSAVIGGRSVEPKQPASTYETSDLEESVFEVDLPAESFDDDSGRIDWAADPDKLTNRLGLQQNTMESTQRSAMPVDDPSDLIGPVAKTPRPRARVETNRKSNPQVGIEIPEDDEVQPSRTRNILLAGLGLLAGTGLGAAGMFTFGNGEAKPDAKMVAELSSVKDQEVKSRSAMEELQKKFAATEAKAADLEKQKADESRKLLGAEAAKLKAENDYKTLLATSTQNSNDAKKLAADKLKLDTAIAKATEENASLTAAVTKSQKDLEEKSTEVAAAKVIAETAAGKLKAADALLDPILEKLKSAKLIDEKADREAAIKELPSAIKKANLITGDGDSAKIAKELAQIREELSVAKKDADSRVKLSEDKLATAKKESEKQLADAKTAADKAMGELQTKLDTADKRVKDEVTKALADTKKDADEKIAAAKKDSEDRQKLALAEVEREKSARLTDAKQFEVKTAQLTEQFEKQIAAARTGSAVPLSTTAAAKVSEAATSYGVGTTAYFAGRYSDAEQAFAQATASNEADARYWYFLGLCKYAQGRSDEAASDFKKGAEFEGRAKPGRRTVSNALEQVQGSARRVLESARP